MASRGDKDTRGIDANRCPGGDQVQIPRCNLSTDDFLNKEQVARGTVTPAMPRSFFSRVEHPRENIQSHTDFAQGQVSAACKSVSPRSDAAPE